MKPNTDEQAIRYLSALMEQTTVDYLRESLRRVLAIVEHRDDE